MNIYDKIRNFDYWPDVKVIDRPKKPKLPANPSAIDAHIYATALAEYEAALPIYNASLEVALTDQRRLDAQFKTDAINDVFGDDAQRFPATVERLWQIAYERGHSSGPGEIYNYLLDYDEVIKAVKKDLEGAK